jgi:genome maintenance exonuclease 1
LYSNHLGVAGRVDCVAEFDGKLSIIDFKTSKKRKTRSNCYNYFMQESGYAIMWEERTKMPITQLVTIMSVDNDDPLVFVEQRDDWTEKLRETIKTYEAEQRQRKPEG